MPGCAVPNCKSRSDQGFRLFRFPADATRRGEWTRNTRRTNWEPNDYSRICEVHFEECQFKNGQKNKENKLVTDAVPTLFDVPNLPRRITRAPRKSIIKKIKQVREATAQELPSIQRTACKRPGFVDKSTPKIARIDHSYCKLPDYTYNGDQPVSIDPTNPLDENCISKIPENERFHSKMAQLLQDWPNCYICDQLIAKNGTDIFTSATENTRTTISDLLEQFTGHSLTRATDKSLCCSDCLSRINDYDLACYTAHQVQKELTDLLSATDEKYSNNALYCIEEIEDDDVDESREEVVPNSYDHDGIDEDQGEFGEAPCRVLKIEQDSEASDDIKVEPLDIETDEYELHSYSVVGQEDDIYGSGDDDNAQGGVYQVHSNPVDLLKQEGQSDPIDDPDSSLPRSPPNYCLQCERNFKTRELLRDHRRTFHKKSLNIHSCDICDKVFKKKGALTRHMHIHTGECPYQCEKCGKKFIHHSSFRMHSFSHDQIRKEKCEVCGLLFGSISHLKRHSQVHTGVKPHKCPKCDKTFGQRYNMMVHLRSHQRKRKHKQTNCVNN